MDPLKGVAFAENNRALGNGSYAVLLYDGTDDGQGLYDCNLDPACTAGATAGRVRLSSTGTAGPYVVRSRRKTEVLVGLNLGPDVRAVITTNNNTTTLGSLVVDGRNHDENGVLVTPGETGTLGMRTIQDYDQGGSSEVGGTAGGIDYEPDKPGDTHVIEHNAARARSDYEDPQNF